MEPWKREENAEITVEQGEKLNNEEEDEKSKRRTIEWEIQSNKSINCNKEQESRCEINKITPKIKEKRSKEMIREESKTEEKRFETVMDRNNLSCVGEGAWYHIRKQERVKKYEFSLMIEWLQCVYIQGSQCMIT